MRNWGPLCGPQWPSGGGYLRLLFSSLKLSAQRDVWVITVLETRQKCLANSELNLTAQHLSAAECCSGRNHCEHRAGRFCKLGLSAACEALTRARSWEAWLQQQCRVLNSTRRVTQKNPSGLIFRNGCELKSYGCQHRREPLPAKQSNVSFTKNPKENTRITWT